MPHDVFISHSSRDKATADAVVETLEARSIGCWIAPRDILPGTDWSEAIVRGISESKVVVLVFSTNANESPQVRREVQRAFEKDVTVIPFRIDPVMPHPALEYYISSVHWLDASGGVTEKHLNHLADEIERFLIRIGARAPQSAAVPSASTPAVPPPPPPTPPVVAAAPPHNLPHQVTTFVGREQEIREVKDLLSDTQLLTLVGPGGSGKTRLSVRVASDLLEEYPDGIWLVELAPISDPSLLPQTVAAIVGVREEPGRTIDQTLVDYLRNRRMLLLLDNCEHLLDACARLVDAIIRACPQVKILASSREGLAIPGEQTFRVPSLSTPDPRRKYTPEGLLEYESVRLFVERAQAAKPSFVLTEQNAASVASICYRLDGIPLALELAAARVMALSVERIDERLDDRFRLLTGGSRTALPRQQTLRALIDWSYDLLNEQERAVLQRLAVFLSGWTLEAAEQICAGEGVEDWGVLDLLTNLVEKSLVVFDEGARERYRMLETVRQYAIERLRESGEYEAAHERHRDYFLTLAEEARPKLVSAEQTEWFARLDAEHDNLRAALEWCKGVPESAEIYLRLASALWIFWEMRGFYAEGRDWLESALKAAKDAPAEYRARALHGAGWLASLQGDYAQAEHLSGESLSLYTQLGDKGGIADALNSLGEVARRQGNYSMAKYLHEQSLSIRRELQDKPGIAGSLNNLGIIAKSQGDFEAARALYEESLQIYRELEDQTGIAISLNNLGASAQSQGDYVAARALYEEALEINRNSGNRAWQAMNLHNLGEVARLQGDLQAARQMQEESLAILREFGFKEGIAVSLYNLGIVAMELGDYASSRTLYEESLRLNQELGDKRAIAEALEGFAALEVMEQHYERAARLWGAADTLRESINAPRPPAVKADYEKYVALAVEAIGKPSVEKLRAEGREMEMEAAIEFALAAGEKSLA